ncbi:MAG: TlpA family protein disulfide reductase [Planctomycetia bacterium]|nr:TlpA family protein disulfide reductase [Planctomycetia bacterium]
MTIFDLARRRPTAAFVAVLAAAGWACGGCSTNARSAASGEPRAAVTSAEPAKSIQGPARAIEVTVVDKEGLAKALERHRGKVVLVDYWATWCGPCVAQFPHTVELSRKYRDQGLAVIGLSMDAPDDIETVRAFLAEKGAKFDNLLSKFGSDAKAFEEFNLDGALPNYDIYDREGNLATRICPADPTIKYRPSLIDEAIEALLATPAP